MKRLDLIPGNTYRDRNHGQQYVILSTDTGRFPQGRFQYYPFRFDPHAKTVPAARRDWNGECWRPACVLPQTLITEEAYLAAKDLERGYNERLRRERAEREARGAVLGARLKAVLNKPYASGCYINAGSVSIDVTELTALLDLAERAKDVDVEGQYGV